MKQSFAAIFILSIFSCNDPWEKRDKIEAQDMCHCMEPWQKTVSKNLEDFYRQTAEVSNDGSLGSESYQWDKIRNFKTVLSDSELEWNKKFGNALQDPNSAFSKCWGKKYEWDSEYRGNNSNSDAPGNSFEMGCTLAYYIPYFKTDKDIMNIVFE